MTAVAPFGPNTQRTERQSDIVRNDQQVFERDLLLLEPIADGLATQIHVGRRFEQQQEMPAVTKFGHITVTSRTKRDIGHPGQGVQYFETYVVTGIGIFGADISQSDDQVFQCRSETFTSQQPEQRHEQHVSRERHKQPW